MSLHLGHTVMLMDRWTAEGALERIERYRVTSSHMVPTMFNRLLQLPDEVRERHDVSSLRSMVHAAAPCPIETKRRMIEWWGDSIWEYYAATEGGGTSVSAAEWTERPGTVGRAWSGCATASAARSCPGRSTTSERGLIGGQSAGWSFPLLFASLTGRSGHGPAPYGPGRPPIRGASTPPRCPATPTASSTSASCATPTGRTTRASETGTLLRVRARGCTWPESAASIRCISGGAAAWRSRAQGWQCLRCAPPAP